MDGSAVRIRDVMDDLAGLVEAAQGGDLDAYSCIVERLQDMVYGYALSILHDGHLAQDAAQEAFVEAYRKLADLRRPAAFPGWIRRITFTRCDRMVRGSKLPTEPTTDAADVPDPTHDHDPAAAAERAEFKQQVMAALASLPEAQRTVTTLYYINGYSTTEISDFLEVPTTTINKRLHDSRRKLKDRMLHMVEQNLHEQSPSRDPQFSEGIMASLPDRLKCDDPYEWAMSGVNAIATTPTGREIGQAIGAVVCGDVDTVRQMLKRKPGLVNVGVGYATLLHFAVHENQLAVVKCLLEAGADPCVKPAREERPLELARERGFDDIATLLEKHMKKGYGICPEGNEIAAIIREGNRDRVTAMLDKSPDLVHAADVRGNRPIHWAVMTRRLLMIDLMLDRGADINIMRPDGARPIDVTNGDYYYRGWREAPVDAIADHTVVIGYMLARGADYDLVTACKIGDLARVRELLAEDPKRAREIPKYSTWYSGYPLRVAAGGGHKAIVELLLECGADPNMPEPGLAPRGGALHAALGNGNIDTVRVLLEAGADPNGEMESCGNCMSHARKSPEMVKLLASYGGTIGLEMCCYDGDVETAASMLDANPNLIGQLVERVDETAGWALGMAAGHETMTRLFQKYEPDFLKHTRACPEDLDQLRVLLEQGMDPDQKEWPDHTVLHDLAKDHYLRHYPEKDRLHRVEQAKLFIEFGADINAIDYWHRSTPLGAAVRAGQPEMVEMLLSKGADPNLAGAAWAMPLAWATKKGHRELAELLRQHGATDEG